MDEAGLVDPASDPAAVAQLADRLTGAGVAVVRGQPLGPLTTLGVGGPAAVFCQPATPAELGRVLTALAAYPCAQVPLLVVGRGSNLLVSDTGWPGLALRLGAGFKWVRRDGELVSAGAAEAMPAVTAWAAREGLAGLEFGAGIPASVGGCVRMNAGAHGGQTADGLLRVEVATAEGPRQLAAAQLRPGYRSTTLPPRAVVTAATWRLAPAPPAQIRARLDALRSWRRATQPLRQRNCGSVFTNPDGESAGRLIDAAGLRGTRVGGAAVSEKHANFIVVSPGARAADVAALIRHVQQVVLASGGPPLVPEVRLVGSFPPA